MLPDMSDVLDDWKVPVRIKTITKQTTDFVDTSTVAGRDIDAVIQVAQKERLNTNQIDFSLAYKTLHSESPVSVNELLEFEGADYKIIDAGDWQRYGYTEALCEATNRPVVAET